ncbi:MAG: hypothetical protein LBU70_05670 [Chitinispirillales bacterium]|jgi:hypothetical protein|nr:hypothetical protein [Chitinispirillales bacterium]
MTDTDILNEMIKDTALIALQFNEYDKPYILLNEPEIPDSNVTIYQPPLDTIVIKADACFSLDNIFKGEKGECKRADYIIISVEKKCILYVELKMMRDSWGKIVKQFKGAQCFVKYCQEIANVFWNKKDFLAGYKNQFINIRHISRKRKTRLDKEKQTHSTPETAMKIYSPGRLQFNHIANLSN